MGRPLDVSIRSNPGGQKDTGPATKESDDSMTQTKLVERLLETDTEFKKLHEEHQSCEGRLDELNRKPLLSQAEAVEAKKIKLHKLALKDRMALKLRSADTS